MKSSTIAASLLAMLGAGASPALADGAGSAGGLLRFWESYRQPRTLHYKATTVIDFKTIPPGIVEVAGNDEYWTDGEKYRIALHTDATVFNGMSHDVRWDGERFQDFNPAGSLLIVSKHFKQKTPYLSTPLPLIPFMFLNPGGADEGVKITFDELRSAAMQAKLEAVHPAGAGGTELSVDAGTHVGMECTYLIELSASPAGAPGKIVLRSPAGVDLSTTQIFYKPVACAGGMVELPYRVTTTSRTTDNRLMLEATTTADVMEADVPIPAETFTIDYQTARRVIDVDIPASQRLAALTGKSAAAATATAAAPSGAAATSAPVISPGIAVGENDGEMGAAGLWLRLAGIGAGVAAVYMAARRWLGAGKAR